jgi:hypothetical protein
MSCLRTVIRLSTDGREMRKNTGKTKEESFRQSSVRQRGPEMRF